jgi:hypothetical protein
MWNICELIMDQCGLSSQPFKLPSLHPSRGSAGVTKLQILKIVNSFEHTQCPHVPTG